MATVTIRPNGCSGGMAGANGGKVGRRTASVGWTARSARGNARFLQSIDLDALPPKGVVMTLTVRQVPPTPEAWHVLVHRLGKWLARRDGYQCHHWVTEWTKARRPHLHGMVLGTGNPHELALDVVDYWLDRTWEFGTQDRGQHVVPIRTDLRRRWIVYMAKHCARGAQHYQRERDALPPGWEKSGRLWGRSGSWPVREDRIELDDPEWFRLRRMLRAHAVAEARREVLKNKDAPPPVRRRLTRTRRLLKCNDAKTARARGAGGFIREELVEAMILQALHLSDAAQAASWGLPAFELYAADRCWPVQRWDELGRASLRYVERRSWPDVRTMDRSSFQTWSLRAARIGLA